MSKVGKKYGPVFLDNLLDVLRGVAHPLSNLLMCQPVAEPEPAGLPLPSGMDMLIDCRLHLTVCVHDAPPIKTATYPVAEQMAACLVFGGTFQ